MPDNLEFEEPFIVDTPATDWSFADRMKELSLALYSATACNNINPHYKGRQTAIETSEKIERASDYYAWSRGHIGMVERENEHLKERNEWLEMKEGGEA